MRDGWRTRGRAHVFGENVPHDGGMIPQPIIDQRITDPKELIPHLFKMVDPTFVDRVKEGDFIVAGRNFGCGKPHTNGYIAMQSLGLRVLCESMPGRAVRDVMNLGLPVMSQCEGVTSFVKAGDDIEADYETGDVINHSTGERRNFPPINERIRDTIKQHGMKGMLLNWLKEHPELGIANDHH